MRVVPVSLDNLRDHPGSCPKAEAQSTTNNPRPIANLIADFIFPVAGHPTSWSTIKKPPGCLRGKPGDLKTSAQLLDQRNAGRELQVDHQGQTAVHLVKL